MPKVRTADPEIKIDIGEEVEDIGGNNNDVPRVRCPKCNWSPGAKDLWICKCHHVWNTFDTGGVCPSCLYQWKVTQCLSCKQVSNHSDWYTHQN